LGAGAQAGTTYAAEQEGLGRPVLSGPERRRAVERTIAVMRRVWSGDVGPAAGFLRPEPVPPIVVAGLGPKMAELAGRFADGVCVPVGPTMGELVAVARRACAHSGRDPEQLIVTASLASLPARTRSPVGPGVDRLVVYVSPPFDQGVAQLAQIVSEWTPGVSRRE
jgi:alkanesulfonate monooxygenase SsuD/methylene tetrahydromethanopterin reductase-like flavin-dependent oxidoreductase (luciferase family)